jgi:Mn2+/Fe2+ NRAMP family transporter
MIRYPELPAELKNHIGWRVLTFFGAGAIVASTTIGAGETLFASRGGAIFGYSLLWVLAAGALMKGIQVYTAARHITLTGEHPMTHWRLFPGPRNWVPIVFAVLSLASFPFWHAGLPLALGTMLNWMFGASGSREELLLYARLWGTANVVVIVTLIWLQSYGTIERTQTIIVGVLMASVFAAVLAVQPSLSGLLSGFIPVIPTTYEPWVREAYPSIASRPPWVEIITYIGAVGGGTYDYIGYIGCYREKAWGALGVKRDRYQLGVQNRPEILPIDLDEENLRRGRRWLIPAKVDTGIGFLCVTVFTCCFLILGAVILHPQRLIPEGQNLLNHQAAFLTRMHPALLYVYQAGIFFAFWGTIYGAYELYIRTAFESLGPISRRIREIPFPRFRVYVMLYSAISGVTLMWLFDDPVAIVTPAALFGGVFACGIWCFFMIWADRSFLPRPLRMGRVLLALTLFSGGFLTFVGIRAIWDYISGLLS